MVGDPSGKSAERNLLSAENLNHNVACLESQLKKFLDFDSGDTSAVMVNNYDWFKNFSFLDFIRDVGKHLTVNYMMAKDSVKKRLEGDTGMSFTEFSYQLVQGYDFYYLWKEQNCLVQMGGSDQWGNMVTGTELIRRKAGGTAFAITTQLIKKADGTKFGKTEEGAIWLDPAKTSPFKFYQFWLNTSDDDAKTWIRIFTLKTQAEIEGLEKEHNEAPQLRILQKSLAEEITTRAHGEAALQTATKTTDFLFGNGSLDFLRELSNDVVLDVFEGIPQFTIAKSVLVAGVSFSDILAEHTAVFPSKGEARKMIQGGGVALNKEKMEDPTQLITVDNLVNDGFLVVQKGKKNYFLIRAE